MELGEKLRNGQENRDDNTKKQIMDLMICTVKKRFRTK